MLFTVIPTRNTRPMTVLCPWQTPNLSRLTAFPQVLITNKTRIITCVSRVLHVFTTCAARGCPRANILNSSKIFAASDVVPIFPRVLPRLWIDCSSSWTRHQREQHRLLHGNPFFDGFWPWNHAQEVMKIWWTWSLVVIFGQFWLGRALYGVWPSAAVPLLKHCLCTA